MKLIAQNTWKLCQDSIRKITILGKNSDAGKNTTTPTVFETHLSNDPET